jgi:hypothetical protein
MSKRSITIEFDSDEIATHFATWLCEAGEQDYWNWIRYQEQNYPNINCAISFDYHGERDDLEFMQDWTIRTKSGRLDQ